MRILLTWMIAFLVLSSCTRIVNVDDLELRDGRYFVENSDEPYSGKVYSEYNSGIRKLEGRYEDGLKEGTFIKWYSNGEKKSEVNYSNGKRNGQAFYWYEDGNLKYELVYHNNKKDGLFTKYFRNGEKQYEKNYINGKLDGKVTHWYADGTKKKEYDYESGVKDGVQTDWYETGSKKAKIKYDEGKVIGEPKEWFPSGKQKLGRYKALDLLMKKDFEILVGKFTLVNYAGPYLRERDKCEEIYDLQSELTDAGIIEHRIDESIIDYYGKEIHRFEYQAELTPKGDSLVVKTLRKEDVKTVYEVKCGQYELLNVVDIMQEEDSRDAEIEFNVSFIPSPLNGIAETMLMIKEGDLKRKVAKAHKFEDGWKIVD